MIRGGIAQEQDGVLFRHDDDAIFVPWDAPPALHEAAYRTLFCMERLPLDFDSTQLTHASEDDTLWFDLLAVTLKRGWCEDCTIYPDECAGFDFTSWFVWGGIAFVILMAVACLFLGRP